MGPRSIARLPELVHKVELQRKPIDAIDLLDDPTPLTPVRRASTVSAWVDVMFGCDYKCAFCAVPSARGRERSRPPQHVFDEIDELGALGYKEVTLLGQTVNAYGRDWGYRLEGSGFRVLGSGSNGNIIPLTAQDARRKTQDVKHETQERIDFTWLLEQIDRRAPQLRVRFTSPHPQLFTDRLIRAVADLPSVCEHVHLPLQSGHNDVLRRMKRTYTMEKFRAIAEKLREAVPGIAITTDLIAGFPGETEEQHQATLRVLEEIQFDQAFMFAYSPRRNTEAAAFGDHLPDEVKKRRLAEIIALQNEISRNRNEALVGQTFEVLVEGPSEKDPTKLSGRTRHNKTMVFEGNEDLIGQLVPVRATKGYLWGFEGVMSNVQCPMSNAQAENLARVG
jgi:tRNA-2-methylthio-N6-dimethylallyladenosine synthase